MAEEIIDITSISRLHELNGFDKPTHPLISIIDLSKWDISKALLGSKVTLDLYAIAMKDASCGLAYGRNSYDFNEGVLIFTAPHQVLTVTKEQKLGEVHGWMIFFHPDLIRNTALGKEIDAYHFFSYDIHEALHLSDAEQQSVTECVKLIQSEIGARIDNHSQRVIVSTLELLLNYCSRYYERQFLTRAAGNKDIVSRFESLLKDYYKDGKFSETGTPPIGYFAEQVRLSPNYLRDLLKKETGLSPKDHINNFIVEKAKTLLLGSEDSVSEIAYSLGFNYPHYFSRLFKTRTGLTPQQYRGTN